MFKQLVEFRTRCAVAADTMVGEDLFAAGILEGFDPRLDVLL